MHGQIDTLNAHRGAIHDLATVIVQASITAVTLRLADEIGVAELIESGISAMNDACRRSLDRIESLHDDFDPELA